MTVQTLTMPRLSETMEEGTVVGWLVEPGKPFRRGEPILELETDKTVVEFPALGDGVLQAPHVGPGDRVPVGAPIATADVANPADWSDAPAEASPAPDAAPIVPAPEPRQTQTGRLRATPLARRIARQKGVALEGLIGTGRRGRIERADVEGAAVTASQAGGLTFLLIHGFGGEASAWGVTLAGLRRAGRRAEAFDLPGHGANPAAAPDLAALTASALAAAQALPGPLVLVGHSLGAAVAVALAGALGSRVQGLVLLTPAGCGPRINADFVHGLAGVQGPGELSHLLRLLGDKGGALSEPALAQMASGLSDGRLRPLADAPAAPDGRQRIDLIRALESLPPDLPIRALFGRQDRIVTPSDALNLPPRVAVHVLPTGHMPQWDDPQTTLDLILKGATHG